MGLMVGSVTWSVTQLKTAILSTEYKNLPYPLTIRTLISYAETNNSAYTPTKIKKVQYKTEMKSYISMLLPWMECGLVTFPKIRTTDSGMNTIINTETKYVTYDMRFHKMNNQP